MSSIPTLPGIRSHEIQTARLKVHYLETGPADGEPVLYIHGNASSATFYEELMLSLPPKYHSIAMDMRGYGDTEPLGIDATRGARDGSDDMAALLDALHITQKVHLVGWSLGGGWVMQFMIDHPERVRSATLIAPVSPFGFSGTKGLDGTPCFEDFAASGGGSVAPDFPKLVKEGDRSADSPMSPRNVMLNFLFKPPFKPRREEAFLSSLLSMQVKDDVYPGNFEPSPNWPGVGPGTLGVINAFAPKYFNTSGIVKVSPKAPVLWIRGAEDQIVSNTSFWDLAMLGSIGAVPGWPGAEICPPQPMIDQTRHILDQYQAEGGFYKEVVFEDCGHSPLLEKEERFVKEFTAFLAAH